MISVEGLANLLGVPVTYLVRTYIGTRSNRFVTMLSQGTLGFERVVDIINSEANRPYGTGLARLAQRKLADGSIRCGADGRLKVS